MGDAAKIEITETYVDVDFSYEKFRNRKFAHWRLMLLAIRQIIIKRVLLKHKLHKKKLPRLLRVICCHAYISDSD